MLNQKNVIKSTIIGCCTLLAAVMTAKASPISAGQSISAVGELDPVGATILFQTNISFSSASFSGHLISTVLTGDLSNSFGGLTFTYQFDITNGLDSAKDITVGSLAGGFGGYLTDVSYQLPTNGLLAPSTILRSPTGGGRNITFDFGGVGYVNLGQLTAILVVQTSANGFAFGNASIQDDVASPNVMTLVPVTIPEPTTIALISLGAAGLFWGKRRRA